MPGFLEGVAARIGSSKALPEPRLLGVPRPGAESFSPWSTRLAVKDGFKSNVWVYAATKMIAQNLARVPWIIEQRVEGAGETTEVFDHPALDILNQPNPLQGINGLMELAVYHLWLAGNAVWLKLKASDTGAPMELHPLEPDCVHPVKGFGFSIDEYIYNADGQEKHYLPEEIIHFMFQDPANPCWGVSPLQAASRVIDTDVEATKWNKAALEQRGVPAGVIAFDEDLTDEQFFEAVDHVQNQWGGSANARKMMVLGNRAKWQQVSQTPVDMDFIPGRKFSLVEISAAMGVLPAMFAPDAATFSNLQEARKALWVETITSTLELLSSTMNRQLLPDFTDTNQFQYSPDLSDIDALRDEFDKRVDAAGKMADQGTPWNQAAQRMDLGLDDVEGGDEPHGLTQEVVIARIKSESSLDEEEQEVELSFEGEDGEIITAQRTHKAVSSVEVAEENKQTEALLAIGRKREPELEELFELLVFGLQDGLSLNAIDNALSAGHLGMLERLMPFEEFEAGIRESDGILKEILQAAAVVAIFQLSADLGRAIDLSLGDGFPTTSVGVRTGNIAKVMRDSSQRAVENAWNRLAVDEELRTLNTTRLYFKLTMGLSQNEESSMRRFYLGLIENGTAESEIAKNLNEFSQRQVKNRATNFAQTESGVQSYRGRTDTWDQANKRGLLQRNARRIWVTSRRGNVCPICLPMDGQRAKLGEKFFSSYNGKFYLHPGPEWVHGKCACGEILTSFV